MQVARLRMLHSNGEYHIGAEKGVIAPRSIQLRHTLACLQGLCQVGEPWGDSRSRIPRLLPPLFLAFSER